MKSWVIWPSALCILVTATICFIFKHNQVGVITSTKSVQASPSFNEVVNSGDKYVGTSVEWQGMIDANVTQEDGIKFYILDADHSKNSWKDYEWFWAMPADMPSAEETKGNWVQYMLKKYGDIDSKDVDQNSDVFEVEGKLLPSDCDYYDYYVFKKRICTPVIEVGTIIKDIIR